MVTMSVLLCHQIERKSTKKKQTCIYKSNIGFCNLTFLAGVPCAQLLADWLCHCRFHFTKELLFVDMKNAKNK